MEGLIVGQQVPDRDEQYHTEALLPYASFKDLRRIVHDGGRISSAGEL